MKKYVFIQSDRNINVTSGLNLKNITNPALAVKDNMKVKPLWPQMTVQLLVGKYCYPSIIVDFKTVQALKNSGKITIGEFTDEIPENERPRVLAIEKKLRPLYKMIEEKEAKKKIKKESTQPVE